MARIVSRGYGRNEYIETERDLVVVTAPGPGFRARWPPASSQLYHDHQQGIRSTRSSDLRSGTAPDHPEHVHEAATADLDDVNMIDHFHLAAYGEQTVNYNQTSRSSLR